MRKLVFRLVVLAGVVLTLGACADSPTQSDHAPDLAAQDEQVVTPQGCVSDGLCVLPPISGGWCEPWMELDWDCDTGECLSTIGPSDPTDSTVQGCPGGGGDTGGGGGWDGGGDGGGGDPGTICIELYTEPCPSEEEEEYSDICPQPILGKVAIALVPIAGRNHEFKFEGTFSRVNPLVGRSPAWYEMDQPALSKDSWWMAESGNLLLVCWGRYGVIAGKRLWFGTVYV
jgi:hypothetical protein